MTRVRNLVGKIRHDVEQGVIPKRFRGTDLMTAHPDWPKSTCSNFLPKHRIGNPNGNTEHFIQHEDGSYSLIKKQQ